VVFVTPSTGTERNVIVKRTYARNVFAPLVALAVASAIGLAGCSVTNPVPASSESATTERDASIDGSRLCFVKKGNGTITVNPSPNVVSDPEMLSGEGGPISTQERCFTGYNAYNDVVSSSDDSSTEEDVVVDVTSPSGAIRMLANNPYISAPQFGFDTDFRRKEKFRDGKIFGLSEGDKSTYTYKGFKFTVERRGDSSDFKEILVTFITPAN
jgi:hypothetical protein